MLRGRVRNAVRCFLSVSIERATNVASAPIASDSGLNGRSIEPNGVGSSPCTLRRRGVTGLSSGRRSSRCLNIRILIVHVARAARWIKWLPPIDSASPSPVTTYGQIRARRGKPGGDRWHAAVDRMDPVRVRVFWEARAQPIRRSKTIRSLRRMCEVGHEALDRGQDGVVPATRAPAHFLVGLEVPFAVIWSLVPCSSCTKSIPNHRPKRAPVKGAIQ